MGSLVRSLLIQVQKVKVDGAFAMSALDKLLRSNELNFAFLAFVPTLLISYFVVNYVNSLFVNRKGFGYNSKMFEIRVCLRY
jgi:nuclear-control-of-ATPase protein 2